MTEHPEELLAEYVDGTLEPGQRARVQAHLSSCATCGGEVESARSARAALRQLPELEEPPGVAFRAIKESRRPPRRWVPRIAAAGAAAAVIAGLVAFAAFFALGDGGGPDDETAAPAAGAPAEQENADAAAPEDGGAEQALAAASYPQLRPAEGPLDAEALSPLARDLRDEARSALREGFPSDAATFYEGFQLSELSERSADAADALGCVTDAFAPDRSVVPFVILDGRFEGEPSYIASFLQGPGPDERYDRIVLIVADRADCELQTVAGQRL